MRRTEPPSAEIEATGAARAASSGSSAVGGSREHPDDPVTVPGAASRSSASPWRPNRRSPRISIEPLGHLALGSRFYPVEMAMCDLA